MSTNANYVPHSAEATALHRSTGYWNDELVVHWVEYWAHATPGKIAVEPFAGRPCSYGELNDRSLRFANALLSMGFKAGDLVAIQLPSSVEFLIAYLGVQRMGGILATMHMPYREGELEPLVRFAEAKAIICGPATASYEGPRMMARLRQRVPSLQLVILVNGESEESGTVSMEKMIATAEPAPIAVPPKASDPVLLCYTSGTSAAPKGIMRSSETITADARVYVRELGQVSTDRAMIAPPFTHVFGLLCVNNTFYTGGTVIPVTHFEPRLYSEMIDRLKPTIVYSAPAHLAATLKSGQLKGKDLSTVRQVVLGGAICPPQVAASFEAHLPNGRVGALFGMTEVLLITQTPLDAPPEIRHASIGRPIPGVNARIVTSSGKVTSGDDEGELQLSGFTILAAYMKNPDANAAAFTADGWFRTGDLAVWGADGNIIITGRVKDLINRGGIKINPSDIENAVMDHPSVVLAAVVPMPDDVLGERICAFVTLVPGATLTLEQLCAFLSEKGVGKMRWPERLVVIDEMPMTPTKKIIKGALRSQIHDLMASGDEKMPVADREAEVSAFRRFVRACFGQ